MTAHPLVRFIEKRKMVICVGAGGVGKTTLTAVLAIAAARRGRNVTCLTIDPAKRLADTFGGTALASDGRLTDVTHLLPADTKSGGRLWFGMLDAHRTMEALVRQRTSSSEQAERILQNRLYRYVSTSLSGLQDYMALEYLCRLEEEHPYDLIVLDTPPSSSVIRFFTAPERMRDALEGPLVQMMRRMTRRTSSYWNPSGHWLRLVFERLAAIAGKRFFDDMVEFVDALSDLFDGLGERAVKIQQMLSGPDTEVLMVTTPEGTAVQEMDALAGVLQGKRFPVTGVVFNRCYSPRIEESLPDDLSAVDSAILRGLIQQWNRKILAQERWRSLIPGRFPELSCVCCVPYLLPRKELDRISYLCHFFEAVTPATVSVRKPNL